MAIDMKPLSHMKLRAVWISDVHLGCKDCKAELLLEFLEQLQCETLYLVGDIIDLWALKRQAYWPESHQRVLDMVATKARKGTRIIYIPGNHDHPFRHYAHEQLFGVQIARRFIHMTSTGKRLLLVHGDEFDAATRFNRLNRWIGDFAYDALLWMNRASNHWRRLVGKPYWSLAGWMKQRVGKVQEAIAAYEQAAIETARSYPADGIVCGHIHHPAIRQHAGILYINDGDWVESCTAGAETLEGELILIDWLKQRSQHKTNQFSPEPVPIHDNLSHAAREALA
ncbi:MAG: UDP-2,3-diacylglucosamine diphosphatase [Gammaproteobacteria bacterium]|nr:MAG: UDP-2,3-diacylglucosamine diphosphatase [Gammaproteobacteria bacterium]